MELLLFGIDVVVVLPRCVGTRGLTLAVLPARLRADEVVGGGERTGGGGRRGLVLLGVRELSNTDIMIFVSVGKKMQKKSF